MTPEAERIASLTPTQLRVLRAGIGGTSKSIAQSLGMSPHTVDGHFRQIIRTLGVTTRQEAVRLFAAAEQDAAQRLSAQPPAIELSAVSDMLEMRLPLPLDEVRERSVLREDRAVFGGPDLDLECETRHIRKAGTDHELTRIHPLVQAVLAALAITLLAAAVPRLGATFQTLSNIMQPYH